MCQFQRNCEIVFSLISSHTQMLIDNNTSESPGYFGVVASSSKKKVISFHQVDPQVAKSVN